ncbi:MAG: amidohydrolase family protein [Pelomonas sp.]|nr:amidohydrolase family protein [Roseateles sp.]
MLRHLCARALPILLLAAPACFAQDQNPFARRAPAVNPPPASSAAASAPARPIPAATPRRPAPVTAASPAAAASAAHAPAPFVASAPLALELHNARWFDGKGFQRGTLFVLDGRFTPTRPKRVNRRMDLGDQYLVAPLADAHNYNLQNEWAVGQYAQRYLRDGVFYAAMFCADPNDAEAARARLEAAGGPEALFVTACVTSSDGQPLGALAEAAPERARSDFIDKTVIAMDKPEDVARKWPLVLARKPDAVRLMLAESDRPELRARPELWGRLGLTPEVAAAVTQRAHKTGLRVIAHVETAADFGAAVRAGVDWIDHVPGFTDPLGEPAERFALTPELAADAARAQVAVVTGAAAARLFKAPPELQAALAATLKRNLQLLKDAGVTLLLGSDLFTDTAQAELHALAATGVFSNAELLRMATQTTPRALFPKRRVGCFEPGCEASFLLLGADPTADLATLNAPLLRADQGRLITQNLDVAERSDESSISTAEAAKKKAGRGGKSSGKSTGKSGSAPTKSKTATKKSPVKASQAASGAAAQ